jgi:hypothetical protein
MLDSMGFIEGDGLGAIAGIGSTELSTGNLSGTLGSNRPIENPPVVDIDLIGERFVIGDRTAASDFCCPKSPKNPHRLKNTPPIAKTFFIVPSPPSTH